MISPSTSSYADYYEKQSKRVEALGTSRIVLAVGVALLLLVLLSFLRSRPEVWAYVAFLYAAAWHGLDRLQNALDVTRLALVDLQKISDFLKTGPSRDETSAYITSLVKPDDSNVPEALSALCSGQRGAENVRAAANAAFAKPASELSVANFFRTTLVLGGLFGTVLFFAVALGGKALLGGDLALLLPDLRGALASTLTGILGSVSLGYVASKIEQIVEQSVWETESLLGGPLATALASSTQEAGVVNETQLWSSLIEQVRSLKSETVSSYNKLGSDVSAHVAALQELSKQLSELPAVQVPPQLAKLQDVVKDFTSGTQLLHSSATTLVKAVGDLGLYAPAKTLEGIETIKASTVRIASEISSNFATVTADAAATASEIRHIRESVAGIVPDLTSEIGSVTESVRQIRGTTNTIVQAVGRAEALTKQIQDSVADIVPGVTVKIDAVDESVRLVGGTTNTMVQTAGRLEDMVKEIQESVAMLSEQVQQPMPPKIDGLEELPPTTNGEPTGKHELGDDILTPPDVVPDSRHIVLKTLQQIREEIASLSAGIEAGANRISTLVADLAEQHKRTTTVIGSRLVRLETVVKWHERASRAPLMRLLLLPLWPSRRGSTRDGT